MSKVSSEQEQNLQKMSLSKLYFKLYFECSSMHMHANNEVDLSCERILKYISTDFPVIQFKVSSDFIASAIRTSRN